MKVRILSWWCPRCGYLAEAPYPGAVFDAEEVRSWQRWHVCGVFCARVGLPLVPTDQLAEEDRILHEVVPA